MVISEIIKVLEEKLNDRNKVYTLLEYVINRDKSYLLCHSDENIENDLINKLLGFALEIENGTPIQYITNTQYFYGYKFYVDKNVLIPQPDTEILVEKCIESVKENMKILDMCTGSGCIAIALKKNLRNAKIYAVDISEEALDIAKRNADTNNVEIEFVKSNIFENLAEKDFDVIISNPPYIQKDDIDKLPQEVRNEPHLALDGGEDGLKFYREIAVGARNFLKDGGKLFLEIGYNQKEAVEKILQENLYNDINSYKDYGGNFRVIIATK